jgi:hypothetical protein
MADPNHPLSKQQFKLEFQMTTVLDTMVLATFVLGTSVLLTTPPAQLAALETVEVNVG